MRLAFCLLKYYPFGGLERDFLRIATTAANSGHEVTVITQSWEGAVPDNIKLHLIAVCAFTNHRRAQKFAHKLSLYLKVMEFDVVIGFNKLPNLDIYFAADPCYQSESKKKHHYFYQLLPRYRCYHKLEASVFSSKSLALILLLNPSHQKDFINYYHTPVQRFRLLEPSIGKDRQRPSNQNELRLAVRKKYHILPHQKIILMVGSDFKRKGVDRALKAFSSLSDNYKNQAQLWIVGRGHNDLMKHKARKLKIENRVHFFGARTDIVDFYAAADVLLHPAYQETAGMVLIEAIAAGLPVIVGENCGYAFHIQSAKSGIVIPMPFEQGKLNTALKKLFTHEKLFAEYRQYALEYALTHYLYDLTEQVIEAIVYASKNKNT